jgi:tyrosyl-DNA phosphodiesterase 2
VTDAEDETSFEDVPFATMALLSSARFVSDLGLQEGNVDEGERERGERFVVGGVSRMALPSNYGRDALSVEIIPKTAPGAVFRLINVHLDSLRDTLRYRIQQMEILANVLREPGCSGGIIAGDFNAISPEPGGLVDRNGLVDAWVALHGKADSGGATWGVGMERRDGLGPGRLDKVAMLGLKAMEMEVFRPGFIEVPRPGEVSLEIPWSYHCGPRCTFAISGKTVNLYWKQLYSSFQTSNAMINTLSIYENISLPGPLAKGILTFVESSQPHVLLDDSRKDYDLMGEAQAHAWRRQYSSDARSLSEPIM